MMTLRERIELTRRDFLISAGRGIGGVALASLFQADGLLAAEPAAGSASPLAPRPPSVRARAKHCIFLFMEGGVSQVDLFDPKPKLKELEGQPVPEAMTKNVRFAFLQPGTARLLASPHPFRRYGRSGLEMSGLLPHLGACADDL